MADNTAGEGVYATKEDHAACIRLYQDIAELRKKYPQFMINLEVQWRDPRISLELHADGKWFTFPTPAVSSNHPE